MSAAMIPQTSHGSEALTSDRTLDDGGIIADLYQPSLDLLRHCFSPENPAQLVPIQKRKLRRITQSFVLWAGDHDVAAGTLDFVLQRSRRILKLVVNLLCALIRRIGFDLLRNPVEAQRHRLIELLDKARFAKAEEDEEEEEEDDDSESDRSGDDVEELDPKRGLAPIDEALSRISIIVDRLNDLNESLTSPVLGVRDAPDSSTVVGAHTIPIHHSFSNLIRESFPAATESVIDQLGKANFRRFQRLLALRSTAQDATQQTNLAIGALSRPQSSKFKDSGYEGSENASAIAPSVTSSIAERIRSKYPPLPPEGRSGETFECAACGHQITSRTTNQYRKHIILDLFPYSCIHDACKFSSTPFQSRVAWMDHNRLEHEEKNQRLCETKCCILCAAMTHDFDASDSEYGLLAHIAGHLEEIALSVIPQDPLSDESDLEETNPDDAISPTDTTQDHVSRGFGMYEMSSTNSGSSQDKMWKSRITPNNLRSFLVVGFTRQASSTSSRVQIGPEDRAGMVCELVTAIRLADAARPFGPAVKSAMAMEAEVFNSSQSEREYTARIRRANVFEVRTTTSKEREVVEHIQPPLMQIAAQASFVNSRTTGSKRSQMASSNQATTGEKQQKIREASWHGGTGIEAAKSSSAEGSLMMSGKAFDPTVPATNDLFVAYTNAEKRRREREQSEGPPLKAYYNPSMNQFPPPPSSVTSYAAQPSLTGCEAPPPPIQAQIQDSYQQQTSVTSATNERSATFQCSLCPKRFSRAYNLRAHVRTHTNERPFVCGVCGKDFVQQKDRKRHETLHSLSKSYVCRGPLQSGDSWGCGRRFASGVALGRHWNSETGRICMLPSLEEAVEKAEAAETVEAVRVEAAEGVKSSLSRPALDILSVYPSPEGLLSKAPSSDKRTPIGKPLVTPREDSP